MSGISGNAAAYQSYKARDTKRKLEDLSNKVIELQTKTVPPATERVPLPNPWALGILGVICLIIAAMCAGVGLTTNWHHYNSLANTDTDKIVFGSIGLIADGAAIVLLGVSSILWKLSHKCYASLAFVMWLGFAALSAIAIGSFVSERIGDTVANRGASIEQASNLRTQRDNAIALSTAAYNNAKDARERECSTGDGKRCTDRRTIEATALAKLDEANARPIVSTASIGTADPLSYVGEWKYWIRQVQFWGLTLAPSLAGLFFACSMILFGSIERK